jgi:hypothetical protein
MAETTTSTTAPWSGQAPFLSQAFSEAQRLYGSGGPQYYPYQTVAPFSQSTQNALGGLEGMAYNNPLQGAANQYGQNAIGGQYLNSNPYLNQMYDQAAQGVTRNFNESVLPGVTARFGMSGRSGSPGMMNAVGSAYRGLGDSLGGMAANIYGQNYANERGLQQGMAQFAPQLLNSQANLYNNALQAGQTRDEQAQRLIAADQDRFNFNQNRPFQNLSTYLGNIGGNFGGQQTTTSPTSSTPWYTYALGGLGLLGGLL